MYNLCVHVCSYPAIPTLAARCIALNVCCQRRVSQGRSIDEEDRTKDRLWRRGSMTIGKAKVSTDGNNVKD